MSELAFWVLIAFTFLVCAGIILFMPALIFGFAFGGVFGSIAKSTEGKTAAKGDEQ